MHDFPLAARLATYEGAATLPRIAAKALTLGNLRQRRPSATCHCSAFDFPHRAGSGNCPAQSPVSAAEADLDRAAIAARQLADFDRTEARAINQGAYL